MVPSNSLYIASSVSDVFYLTRPSYSDEAKLLFPQGSDWTAYAITGEGGFILQLASN